MATVTLNAVDLLSKEGFDDGDLVDDVLEANGFDSLARPVGDDDETCLDPGFGGAVLGECVRRHLAPRLMGFGIQYDRSIAHNPVRLLDVEAMDPATVREVLAGVSVVIDEAAVLAIAEELAPGYVERVGIAPPRPRG